MADDVLYIQPNTSHHHRVGYRHTSEEVPFHLTLPELIADKMLTFLGARLLYAHSDRSEILPMNFNQVLHVTTAV